MRIAAVGDVVGWPGVKTFSRLKGAIDKLYHPDLLVVNGENASGLGITPPQASELFASGADVITLGNHAWARREIVPYIDSASHLIRPYNYLAPHPGRGYVILSAGGKRVLVVNLLGRALMDPTPENPFYALDRLLKETEGRWDLAVVDFHAEATSEKIAFFRYFAGRVSVIFGTHTHVQTADEQILRGTGYITDLGMTGPTDSVLGVKEKQSIAGYRGEMRDKFETADGPTALCGACFELDEAGSCVKAERIRLEP